MDYVKAAATGILSPHVLLVEDLKEMLFCIQDTLPPTMHLPVMSEDVHHFSRYLHTHLLIAEEQFLLLIDVPIQDHAQQLEIYEVFNLAIPLGNFSAPYSIHNRNLGITHDETKAVEILEDQFKTCQKANRQLFQFKDTPSTTHQPTNLCISFVCKGQGKHPEKMFTTDQERQ